MPAKLPDTWIQLPAMLDLKIGIVFLSFAKTALLLSAVELLPTRQSPIRLCPLERKQPFHLGVVWTGMCSDWKKVAKIGQDCDPFQLSPCGPDNPAQPKTAIPQNLRQRSDQGKLHQKLNAF